MVVEKPGEEKRPQKAERRGIRQNPKAERTGTHEHPRQSVRFWRLTATMLGLVWNLVLPIVGGVLLGSYLGRRLGHSEAWTAGLLLAGVAVSLYNLCLFLVEGMRG